MRKPGNPNSVGIYIHIPFCRKKCDYCHFYVIPAKESFQDLLMDGLHQEWQMRLPLLKGKSIRSVYFGGGTPYLLGPERLSSLLQLIAPYLEHDAEISLEANPEDVSEERLRQFRLAGVNRLSMGVQSFDNQLLHQIGRSHNAATAKSAVYTAASAGFSEVSIDLMYDLPGQTLQQWQTSIEEACTLPITHLSFYNLQIEPTSVFFKYRDKILAAMPDEELSLQMVQWARGRLGEAGLMQYEISAFAKEGSQALHNVGYWKGIPFIGYGPSAFSYWEGRRFRNVANLHRYCRALSAGKSAEDFEEQLDPDAARKELLVVGLRMLEGIDLGTFETTYGPLEADTSKALQRLVDLGYFEKEGQRIRLSPQGLDVYNALGAELI